MPTYRVTGFNCRITGGLVIQIENGKLDDKRLIGTMGESQKRRKKTNLAARINPATFLRNTFHSTLRPSPRIARTAQSAASSPWRSVLCHQSPHGQDQRVVHVIHHACVWEHGTARHRNSSLDEPPPISISGNPG